MGKNKNPGKRYRYQPMVLPPSYHRRVKAEARRLSRIEGHPIFMKDLLMQWIDRLLPTKKRAA